jgi:hypothetical protein|tara:strand:+ start:933 stop:1121 length:189 start_codon:yes stop_codon:yes gene_type:complete
MTKESLEEDVMSKGVFLGDHCLARSRVFETLGEQDRRTRQFHKILSGGTFDLCHGATKPVGD